MVRIWSYMTRIALVGAGSVSSPAGYAAEVTSQALIAHNTPTDCWIAIEGKVYDISGYMTEHTGKFEYDLSKWCGQESTSAWNTKDGKGKGHSRKASVLLKKYYVGDLAAKAPGK